MEEEHFAEKMDIQQLQRPYDSLSDYWHDVRKLKGLGMPTITEVTGFHTSSLSRIERSVHRPTVETLNRLAEPRAYGCPWWPLAANQIFIRALAYRLTDAPQYAPRDVEWWPANMIIALAAAEVISKGSTWTRVVQWPELAENWPALGLPGWKPSPEVADTPPPSTLRPLWLWGSWALTQQLESADTAAQDAWIKNIARRDDTTLAAVVVGYLLESAASIRNDHIGGAAIAESPTDADFRSVAQAWSRLSSMDRRLVREFVDALARK